MMPTTCSWPLSAPDAERLVTIAHALERVLYRAGGNVLEDGGLDCSGFCQLVWRKTGLEPFTSKFPGQLDLTAEMMLAKFQRLDRPVVGCVALYDAPGGRRADHVVLVTGVSLTEPPTTTEIMSASNGNLRMVTVEEARAKKAWVTIWPATPNRPAHLYRDGFIGFFAPVLVG